MFTSQRKAMSASEAVNYFEEDFNNPEETFSFGNRQPVLPTEYLGSLAETLGLNGPVKSDEFRNLVSGRHPVTGQMLSPLKKRAGFAAAFGAPKGYTLAALVGGDERLVQFHLEAVREAVKWLEQYAKTQGLRHNGQRRPVQTGNLLVSAFTHTTARPVEGFISPHLHTHVFIHAFTRTDEARFGALEAGDMFEFKHYIGTVYRNFLARKVLAAGYHIEHTPDGLWDIKGFSPDYLALFSARSRQIANYLEHARFNASPANRRFAALKTRDHKETGDQDLTRFVLDRINERFGQPALNMVERARQQTMSPGGAVPPDPEYRRQLAQAALAEVLQTAFEHESVLSEKNIFALVFQKYPGQLQETDIADAFATRKQQGEVVQVVNLQSESSDTFYTTRHILTLEKHLVERMLTGQNRYATLTSYLSERLATQAVLDGIQQTHPDFSFNQNQQESISQILGNTDQIIALQGKAGTGKSTILAVVRQAAEREGLEVVGLAPSGNAQKILAESGVESRTLQGFVRSKPAVSARPTLYLLDESSLAGTQDVYLFFQRLRPQDRVILVGDTSQHTSVEAGAIFELLQKNGITTVHLSEIVRQLNPQLKSVVESLSRTNLDEAVDGLQGISYPARKGSQRPAIIEKRRSADGSTLDLQAALVDDFVEAPGKTLAIVSDNRTRKSLNQQIHERLFPSSSVPQQEMTILARESFRRASLSDISSFRAGQFVQFHGIRDGFAKGETIQVQSVDPATGTVSGIRATGESVQFSPSSVQSRISLYHPETRQYSIGERIQFITSFPELGIVNRTFARIRQFLPEDKVLIELEGGRTATVGNDVLRFSDYGYTATSHSIQGAKQARVLVFADTQKTGGIDSEMLYVAASRVGASQASQEALRIYTTDEKLLRRPLQPRIGKGAAMEAYLEAVRRGLSPADFVPSLPVEHPVPQILHDRIVLGREWVANLQAANQSDALDQFLARREYTTATVSDGQLERNSPNSVKHRAKLHARLTAEGADLSPAERRQYEATLTHAFVSERATTLDQIEESFSFLLQSKQQQLQKTEDYLARLAPVTEQLSVFYRNQKAQFPVPFVEREALDVLQNEALRVGNLARLKTIDRIRRQLAQEFGQPEFTIEGRARLQGQREIALVNQRLTEQKLRDFDRYHTLWNAPNTPELQGKSIQKVAAELNQAGQNLRWQEGSIEFYRTRIEQYGERPKLVEGYRQAQVSHSEAARVFDRLQRQAGAVSQYFAGRKQELGESLNQAAALVQMLDAIVDRQPSGPALEPKFTASELTMLESTALRLRDSELLTRYVTASAHFVKEENQTRTGPSQLSTRDLARRALARDQLVGFEVELAQQNLTTFQTQQFQKKVSYRDLSGKARFTSLEELEKQSGVQRFRRRFQESFEHELAQPLSPPKGRLGLDDVAVRLGTVVKNSLERLEDQLMRTDLNRVRGTAVNGGIRLLTAFKSGLGENPEDTHARQAVQQALRAQEDEFRTKLKEFKIFRITTRFQAAELAQPFEREGMQPLFTNREANRVESIGLSLKAPDRRQQLLDLAARASLEIQASGFDHPLLRPADSDPISQPSPHDAPERQPASWLPQPTLRPRTIVELNAALPVEEESLAPEPSIVGDVPEPPEQYLEGQLPPEPPDDLEPELLPAELEEIQRLVAAGLQADGPELPGPAEARAEAEKPSPATFSPGQPASPDLPAEPLHSSQPIASPGLKPAPVPAKRYPSSDEWKLETDLLNQISTSEVVLRMGGRPLKNKLNPSSNEFLVPNSYGQTVSVWVPGSGSSRQNSFHSFKDDSLSGHGGIRLKMLLDGRDPNDREAFREARSWMIDEFGAQTLPIQQFLAQTTGQPVRPPQPPRTVPALPQREVVPDVPLVMPERFDAGWPTVRNYLVERRRLDPEIVDQAYRERRLYATRYISESGKTHFTNAVFVMGKDPNQPSGAQTRGVTATYINSNHTFYLDDDDRYRDAKKFMAAGTRKDKGPFSVRTGEMETNRLVLVESAVDALSMRQLLGHSTDRGTAILSYGGVSIPEKLADYARKYNLEVVLAFDNDPEGRRSALRHYESLAESGVNVQMVFPESKDWNEDLQRGLTQGVQPLIQPQPHAPVSTQFDHSDTEYELGID